MSHLPPLPALRAFEAVARLGSVTRAAEELHLTHSAVSHQLKLLDRFIGTSLWLREGKRMHLTAAGRSYAYQIRLALQYIHQATQYAAADPPHDALKISLVPSFATHWLAPRLADWYRCHPNIRLILDADLNVVDFQNNNADCAIRVGQVVASDVRQQPLMPDWQLFIAGAADARYALTQSVEEALKAGPLLGDSHSWSQWAEANQPTIHPATEFILGFNDSNVGIAAVRQNLGLILTRWSIVAQAVQERAVKQVTPHWAEYDSHYYLVWPDRTHQSLKFQLFQEWLTAQCQEFEQFSLNRFTYLGQA